MTVPNPNPELPAPTTPPATPPAGETPKVFSQEEVNRLVGVARQEGRDAAAKKTPTVTPAPAPTADDDDEKVTLKSLKATVTALTERTGFDKRVMRFGLSEDDADDLFELAKARGKTGDTEWLEARAKRFSPAPAQQPAPPQQPAPGQQPTTPPASNRGAPAAPQTPPDSIDLLTASKEDVAALIKTKGLRWVTDTFSSQVRDKRFKLT